MPGIAKKGSGQFELSREIGGKPNSTNGTAPGAGSSGAGEGGPVGMTTKGSGQFEVDRGVKSPPTKSPAK